MHIEIYEDKLGQSEDRILSSHITKCYIYKVVLLSTFRFLSYPIKIIKVIIHKHKISKSKDKKICRDWGSNL